MKSWALAIALVLAVNGLVLLGLTALEERSDALLDAVYDTIEAE